MRWVGEAEGGWTKDKPKTGAGEALLPSAGVDAALLGLLLLLLLLGVSRRPSGSAIAAASDRRTAQAGLAGVCVYGLLPLAALREGFQPCVVMADPRFGRAQSFCQAGATCKQPSVAEYWRDVIGESECCMAKRKSVKRARDGMGWDGMAFCIDYHIAPQARLHGGTT